MQNHLFFILNSLFYILILLLYILYYIFSIFQKFNNEKTSKKIIQYGRK